MKVVKGFWEDHTYFRVLVSLLENSSLPSGFRNVSLCAITFVAKKKKKRKPLNRAWIQCKVKMSFVISKMGFWAWASKSFWLQGCSLAPGACVPCLVRSSPSLFLLQRASPKPDMKWSYWFLFCQKSDLTERKGFHEEASRKTSGFSLPVCSNDSAFTKQDYLSLAITRTV